MRIGFAALISAVILSACGGANPEQDCKDQAAASCERMWTCGSDVQFGDDEADCTRDLSALCVAALEINDGEPCPDGQDYDSAAARDCIDKTQAQSCEAFNAGTDPGCEEVCK